MLLIQATLGYPSLPFVDSVWTALDDVHSFEFQEAACECKPFLDEFCGGKQKAVDRTSDFAARAFGAEAGLGKQASLSSSSLTVETVLLASAEDIHLTLRSSSLPAKIQLRAEDIQPTPGSSLVLEKTGPIENEDSLQITSPSEVKSTKKPSLLKAASMCLAQKIVDLPYLKGRSIGVTGYRFIHLHSFQTGIGRVYRGYSLRFPRIFGRMKSSKSKDMAKLVRMRDNMLEAWAKENSRAKECDIAKWISELDKS